MDKKNGDVGMNVFGRLDSFVENMLERIKNGDVTMKGSKDFKAGFKEGGVSALEECIEFISDVKMGDKDAEQYVSEHLIVDNKITKVGEKRCKEVVKSLTEYYCGMLGGLCHTVCMRLYKTEYCDLSKEQKLVVDKVRSKILNNIADSRFDIESEDDVE